MEGPEDKERRYENMPDIEAVKKQAVRIRRDLLTKYSGMDRFNKMTFDEKRELRHWIFDGHDPIGEKFGIYINKKGKGRNALIDYLVVPENRR
jgi:hypothetical protein